MGSEGELMEPDAQTECLLDMAVMPAALIHEPALQHNIDVFSDYCRERDLELAPHVKTAMSEEIFVRQSAAGAWAATVASAEQAEAARRWGATRILIASQVVDPGSLKLILRAQEEDPDLELYLWVDSMAGLGLLEDASRQLGAGTPLRVLVEMGHGGGRTGCRGGAQALELAGAVAASPAAVLAGVSAFEGTVAGEGQAEQLVDDLVSEAVATLLAMKDEGLIGSSPAVLTMGGSVYFDRVASGTSELPRDEVTVVLRSGCYVTHDCGIYDELSPLGSRGTGSLQSALEVWGAVISTPEPSLAIANFGKRHVSFDAGLPRIVRMRPAAAGGSNAAGAIRSLDLEVTALNDHHAFIQDPQGTLQVGDLVGACISHPCTTFDRWRRLVLVDDDYRQVGVATTEF